MIKIVSHTTIRSDFDLMQSIYKSLVASNKCRFKLFVGGAHLSPEYDTFDYVANAVGRENLDTSLTLLESRTNYGQAKSAASYLDAYVEFLHREKPSLVLVVGDREDSLMTSVAASYMRIPSAHFFAGDHAADGHVDNPIRHATSKLTTSHFVTHEDHAKRLVAMGEMKENIYLTGNPGLWKYYETPDNNSFINNLGLSEKGYAIVIFHPVAEEADQYSNILQAIINSVNAQGLIAAVGLPNTDPRINKGQLEGDFISYGSPESADFVNLMRKAAVLVGNSSLGPLESASIPLNCVNVGVRQKGRLANNNVIYVSCNENDISNGIKKAMLAPLPARNVFGDAEATKKIVDVLLGDTSTLCKFKNVDPLFVSRLNT